MGLHNSYFRPPVRRFWALPFTDPSPALAFGVEEGFLEPGAALARNLPEARVVLSAETVAFCSGSRICRVARRRGTALLSVLGSGD